MKWRIELISHLTVISQMVILTMLWWFVDPKEQNGPLHAAALSMLAGLVGAYMIWEESGKIRTESKKNQALIRIIGSVIVTLGAFIVFFPVLGIFYHSTTAIVLLLGGFFLPGISYFVAPSIRQGMTPNKSL